MTEYNVTAKQARQHSIELTLEQLIACQYWAKESIPLPHKKTRAHLVGGHLSPFKGRGMEFSEVRQYQPGDDIRTIDWRVTARTGKVHTKIFQEERERPVYIVTDLQDTMFFGSKNRFKSTLACLQAARAFWAAFNSGNRVAGLFSTAEKHIELKPSNRRQNGLRLLQHLLELHNQRLHDVYSGSDSYRINQNALSDTLLRLRHLVKGGSLIYIFSDFMNLNEECRQHLTYLAQHNDIYGVMVYDPLESSIPVPGQYTLTDGLQHVHIDASNSKDMHRHQQSFKQKVFQVNQCFTQSQSSFAVCSTADTMTELALDPSISTAASIKNTA
ncbi:DUF58 domain-containing protein [Kangiella sediminilitoris]|uniref:DUF58 domain-containing protein n=1 Tax=Kangiella sediminilitoris TaxID=1144748 RepID=A0A1B3B940_9GAMM|nr:DUF58 domain-containing protein [Kangiella sediminilitoris]AOE49318.1 hypothetical protein KS2013_594 [Kangiella sediminilitoris]